MKLIVYWICDFVGTLCLWCGSGSENHKRNMIYLVSRIIRMKYLKKIRTRKLKMMTNKILKQMTHSLLKPLELLAPTQ